MMTGGSSHLHSFVIVILKNQVCWAVVNSIPATYKISSSNCKSTKAKESAQQLVKIGISIQKT